MDKILIFLMAGAPFGIWPLVMRSAGNLNAGWITIFVSLPTLLVGLAAIFFTSPGPASPPVKIWLIGFVSGIINGVGIFAYAKLIRLPQLKMSMIIPLTTAVMLVAAALGSIIFLGEELTLKRAIGLLGVVTVSWLLS